MWSDSGRFCFVSDVHLGAADDPQGRREKEFVSFLRSVPQDTRALFLTGDIFDFWVDYKYVVPRGYTRVLGELAALSDRGCRIFFFRGNHDYWVTDYFEKELGMEVVDEPFRLFSLNGKTFCVGHGDGLYRGSFKERLTFSLFHNPFLIRCLRAVPSGLIFGFAHWWSGKSRSSNMQHVFEVENSPILRFAEDFEKKHAVDCFVFGHFHKPSVTRLPGGATLYILGDWYAGASALYFSGMGMEGRGLPNIQR